MKYLIIIIIRLFIPNGGEKIQDMDLDNCPRCLPYRNYLQILKIHEGDDITQITYWDNRYVEQAMAGVNRSTLQHCQRQRRNHLEHLAINQMLQTSLMNYQEAAHQNH